MKTKILYQEAYIQQVFLSIDFLCDDIEYRANCVYINGGGLEDFEVVNTETDEEATEEVFEYGSKLLEDLDLDKYLTF